MLRDNRSGIFITDFLLFVHIRAIFGVKMYYLKKSNTDLINIPVMVDLVGIRFFNFVLPESWSGHQYESCSEETKVNYTALLDYRPCMSLQVPSTAFVCRLDNLYNLWCIVVFDAVSTGYCHFQR